MEYKAHVRSSLEKLEGSEFIEDIPAGIVIEIVGAVHLWMDYFYGKRGVDESGRRYDYSGVMLHREQRHHRNGIQEAGEHVASHYGESYRGLAEKVAEQHVIDDFGRVLQKWEYSNYDFRRKLQGLPPKD